MTGRPDDHYQVIVMSLLDAFVHSVVHRGMAHRVVGAVVACLPQSRRRSRASVRSPSW
jgi:hypothetical protein